MSKILILGSKGQLGIEIKNKLKNKYKVISLHKGSKKYCGNFLNEKKLLESIRKIKPHIIINAAAFTSVDSCENNRGVSKKINLAMPIKIAYEIKKINSLLIHFSSDYVFSGRGSMPWGEKSKMSPVNFYGKCKALADQGIAYSGCNYVILRSSWIYSAHGKNFLNSILKLAKMRDTLRVVNDQIGAPTSTILIANAVCEIIKNYTLENNNSKFLKNTFNIVPDGYLSWYDYCCKIIKYLEKNKFKIKLKSKNIIGIKSKDFSQIAKRPLNSRLNNEKAKKMFDLNFVPWHEDLHQILKKKLH